MTLDPPRQSKRRKEFTSLAEEAQVNIVRTGNLLAVGVERVLKPHGITATQYNVLRVLRAAEPDGLSRNQVRERLLSHMPDATRLLDRMEKAGLVTRSREVGDDQRLVTTRITEHGRRLVHKLDGVVDEEHQRQLGHLSEKQTRKLIKLLTLVRDRD